MRVFVLVAGLLLAARAAVAQGVTVKEDQPGLLAQAKITADSALKIALARVPGATLQSGEIEREHRRLVYSFDLAVPGRRGIEEVLVDAVTGAVVSQEHESEAKEAAEATGPARAPVARP